MLLSDVHTQPLVALTGSPILAEIGRDRVLGSLDEALDCARRLLDGPDQAGAATLPAASEREHTGTPG